VRKCRCCRLARRTVVRPTPKGGRDRRYAPVSMDFIVASFEPFDPDSLERCGKNAPGCGVERSHLRVVDRWTVAINGGLSTRREAPSRGTSGPKSRDVTRKSTKTAGECPSVCEPCLDLNAGSGSIEPGAVFQPASQEAVARECLPAFHARPGDRRLSLATSVEAATDVHSVPRAFVQCHDASWMEGAG